MKNPFDLNSLAFPLQILSRSAFLIVIIGLIVLVIMFTRRKSLRRTSYRVPLIVILAIAGLLILRAVLGLFMIVLLPVLGLLLLAGGAFAGTLWMGKKMSKSKATSGNTTGLPGARSPKILHKKTVV